MKEDVCPRKKKGTSSFFLSKSRMKKTQLITNLFFVLGFVILGFMIYQTGLGVIWQNIKLTGWWFVAIIGIWAVVYFINAISFHIIVRDGSAEAKSVSLLRIYKLTVAGYAINLITPFGLLGGEPYKVLQLQPALGFQKATSSVLLYMMMHFVSHFIFWMISIPMLFLIVPNVSVSVRIILAVAGAASLLLLYWSFTVYSKGFVSKALRIAARLPFVGRRVRAYHAQNAEQIARMDYLISDLYKNRKGDFVKSLSLELLSRYVLCLEVVFMMYAIGFPVSFTQSVIIESIQSMVGNLFFFMPMQLGAREGGFLLVFGILSIPAAHAIYVALCMRVRELFWILLGLGLIKVGRKRP